MESEARKRNGDKRMRRKDENSQAFQFQLCVCVCIATTPWKRYFLSFSDNIKHRAYTRTHSPIQHSLLVWWYTYMRKKLETDRKENSHTHARTCCQCIITYRTHRHTDIRLDDRHILCAQRAVPFRSYTHLHTLTCLHAILCVELVT